MFSFLISAIKIIFLLGFLVFIHEGGHFLVAKLCKVRVIEFSIGFGPKIFSKETVNTKYTLRAIPFGGYVDLLGMDKKSEEPDSYVYASFMKKVLIIVAGSLVNIIFGMIIYFILVAAYNDIFVAIDALKQFFLAIFESLRQLFSANISPEQLKGPVGISDMVVSTAGISEYLYILALISVSLGITNILPIPPLDGGKLLFLIIGAIRRKEISEKVELKIQTFCFLALISLTIFITYNDVINLF